MDQEINTLLVLDQVNRLLHFITTRSGKEIFTIKHGYGNQKGVGRVYKDLVIDFISKKVHLETRTWESVFSDYPTTETGTPDYSDPATISALQKAHEFLYELARSQKQRQIVSEALEFEGIVTTVDYIYIPGM